jgi:hypothetical protein
MLFLGSGISLPTWEKERSVSGEDIPHVAGITRSVLSGLWKRNGETFESRGVGEPPCEDADRCQRFLQRLAWRVSPYFNDRRGDVNYEDLFYITDELRSTKINPVIQPFTEQMRAACNDLCWQPAASPQWIEFSDLCEQVCDFVRCVVSQQLRRNVTPHGMDLIRDLAQQASTGSDIKRLAICTLNHDALVEKLLDGINYEDGFSDPSKSGFFNPRCFRTRSKRIRLLKLHGSINWYRYQRREGEHYSDHHAVHRQGFKPPPNVKGVKWEPDSIPTILTGSYNKSEAYGMNIFKEFMHAFHSELAEHKLIIMSGYGWGDYAINQRLCEWLGREKSHRIILLSEDKPWSMLASSHVIRYQWNQLIRLRKLVVMRKWLQDTTWAEISERIAKVNKLPACKPPSSLELFGAIGSVPP